MEEMQDLFKRFGRKGFFFNALFCDYYHDILLLTFCKRNCTKILTF